MVRRRSSKERYSNSPNRIFSPQSESRSTRARRGAGEILAALALAAIVWVATREALQGRIDAGEFVVLMTAMRASSTSLRRITNVQSVIGRGVSAAERLFAVLDDHEEPDQGRVALQRARGEPGVRQLRLRYRNHSDTEAEGRAPWKASASARVPAR